MNDAPRAAHPEAPLLTLPHVPFWYLRHGETDWNAQGLSQGSVDIPLNPIGIAQAKAAALMLRNRGIATIVSSPLGRARVTAETVGEALNLPVQIDNDLREVSWGIQEGKAMSDWFTGWVEGRFTPEKAESFAALRQRGGAALGRCLAEPSAVLVVAHGALFRALRAVMGVEPNLRTRNAAPIWCEPPALGQTAWSISYAT
jgi:broad specificity phosphatase PhoE